MSKKNEQPVTPSDDMNRRVFVAAAVGGVGMCYAAAIAYPVYRYIANPIEKAAGVAAVTELTLRGSEFTTLPEGKAQMFKFGPKPALLIHHKEDNWVALEAVCSHLGCTVQYEEDKERIYCACHGGVYDATTGKNISGPPPKPLKPLVAKKTADGIVITRV